MDINMSKIMNGRGAAAVVSLETMKKLKSIFHSFSTWFNGPP